MADLFAALPPLRRATHPLLAGRQIRLIGVSAVLHDDEAYYFEINRPRHWGQRSEGTISVGVGGIGGRLEAGEGPLAALRREVQEELGVRFRFELPEQTTLIHDWQVAGQIDILPGSKHPRPYFINLLPPRLGGAEVPDHLAIVTFLGRPQGQPERRDLFGLLTVARPALNAFFARAEWPLADVLADPALHLDLSDDLPADCVLRPVLTARALGVVLNHEQATGI